MANNNKVQRRLLVKCYNVAPPKSAGIGSVQLKPSSVQLEEESIETSGKDYQELRYLVQVKHGNYDWVTDKYETAYGTFDAIFTDGKAASDLFERRCSGKPDSTDTVMATWPSEPYTVVDFTNIDIPEKSRWLVNFRVYVDKDENLVFDTGEDVCGYYFAEESSKESEKFVTSGSFELKNLPLVVGSLENLYKGATVGLSLMDEDDAHGREYFIIKNEGPEPPEPGSKYTVEDVTEEEVDPELIWDNYFNVYVDESNSHGDLEIECIPGETAACSATYTLENVQTKEKLVSGEFSYDSVGNSSYWIYDMNDLDDGQYTLVIADADKSHKPPHYRQYLITKGSPTPVEDYTIEDVSEGNIWSASFDVYVEKDYIAFDSEDDLSYCSSMNYEVVRSTGDVLYSSSFDTGSLPVAAYSTENLKPGDYYLLYLEGNWKGNGGGKTYKATRTYKITRNGEGPTPKGTGWTPDDPIDVTGEELEGLLGGGKKSEDGSVKVGYFYNVTEASKSFKIGLYVIEDVNTAVPFDLECSMTMKDFTYLSKDGKLVPDTIYYITDLQVVFMAYSTTDYTEIERKAPESPYEISDTTDPSWQGAWPVAFNVYVTGSLDSLYFDTKDDLQSYSDMAYIIYDEGKTWATSGSFQDKDLPVEVCQMDTLGKGTYYLSFSCYSKEFGYLSRTFEIIKNKEPEPPVSDKDWFCVTDCSGNTNQLYVGNPGKVPQFDIEYSYDKQHWNLLEDTDASGSLVCDIPAGGKVYLRSTTDSWYGHIIGCTGNFEVSGNIMSLLYGRNFTGEETEFPSESSDTFNSLFAVGLYGYSNYLVKADSLGLPATTLVEGCYAYMFNSCASLTEAPELPATTLVEGCYSSMFQNCNNLALVKVWVEGKWPGDCTDGWLDLNCYGGVLCNLGHATDIPEGTSSGCPKDWKIMEEEPVPSVYTITDVTDSCVSPEYQMPVSFSVELFNSGSELLMFNPDSSIESYVKTRYELKDVMYAGRTIASDYFAPYPVDCYVYPMILETPTQVELVVFGQSGSMGKHRVFVIDKIPSGSEYYIKDITDTEKQGPEWNSFDVVVEEEKPGSGFVLYIKSNEDTQEFSGSVNYGLIDRNGTTVTYSTFSYEELEKGVNVYPVGNLGNGFYNLNLDNGSGYPIIFRFVKNTQK